MRLLNIHTISEDIVLSTILQRLLLNKFGQINYTKSSSFSEVKQLTTNVECDIILVDFFISGAAKFEVLTYLRNHLKLSTPVIFFSNNMQDEYEALEAGASAVIYKPINPNDLMDRILLLISALEV